jgi:LmbE family N-acetylglucosaminyl deacetylase
MQALHLHPNPKTPLTILCLGAHSDDIEIGCGGTVMTLLTRYDKVQVHWVVLSGEGERAKEAKRSAQRYLRRVEDKQIIQGVFQDGYFPSQYRAIKDTFEKLKKEINPDLVFTHCSHDKHQDHRVVQSLTWNTWRDHRIFEYEIPKYDGDLGTPNAYFPLTAAVAKRKASNLLKDFATQRGKNWFDEETFMGLMRIRGLECQTDARYAEAFYAPKMVIE